MTKAEWVDYLKSGIAQLTYNELLELLDLVGEQIELWDKSGG